MFDWWWQLLYDISFWINKCLDGLYKLFVFFAGVAPAEVNEEIAGTTNTNILVNIFTDNTVAIIFWGFLGLAALVFGISIIIGLARSEWTGKDNSEGKIKIFKQSFKGFLLIILIPTIFSIGIWGTSILLSGIVESMSGTSILDYNLAQKLFEICMPPNDNGVTPLWTDSYATLVAFNYDMTQYNYFIAYIGGIIILFIIGLASLNLIERIIDLVFLYLVSPFVVAVSPLDEGNRLGIWRDLVISKLLSVAGMVMCFYIYFLCLPIVDKIFASDTFVVRLGYLIFAIGGALAARKGGLIISNLVGHNTALIEGQQAGQTAQIVGTGFRAGLGMISALGSSSLHLLAGSKNLFGSGAKSTADGVVTSAAISSTAAASGAEIQNVLQNNATSTFSGVSAEMTAAAGGGTAQSATASGFASTAAASPGSVTDSSSNPSKIINEGHGFHTAGTAEAVSNGGAGAQPAQPTNLSNVINNGQGFHAEGKTDVVAPAEAPSIINTSKEAMQPADDSIKDVINHGSGINNGGDKK